jgi:hypothetical protein
MLSSKGFGSEKSERVEKKKIVIKAKPAPIKQFTGFKNKYRTRLSAEEICCIKISPDGTMIAVSFADGNLKILNPVDGSTMFDIQDDDLPFPVFSMCWKP